jgi:hypothetical protein
MVAALDEGRESLLVGPFDGGRWFGQGVGRKRWFIVSVRLFGWALQWNWWSSVVGIVLWSLWVSWAKWARVSRRGVEGDCGGVWMNEEEWLSEG